MHSQSIPENLPFVCTRVAQALEYHADILLYCQSPSCVGVSLWQALGTQKELPKYGFYTLMSHVFKLRRNKSWPPACLQASTIPCACQEIRGEACTVETSPRTPKPKPEQYRGLLGRKHPVPMWGLVSRMRTSEGSPLPKPQLSAQL